MHRNRSVSEQFCDKTLVGDDGEFDRQECEFEVDSENILNDDGDDRIHGVFVPFSYKWTGKEPAHLTYWYKRASKELTRSDLYAIPKNMRGAVYQLLYERFIEKLRPEFMKCFADYIECCKEVKAVRWLRDCGVVRQCGRAAQNGPRNPGSYGLILWGSQGPRGCTYSSARSRDG